jgi:hypothetical protein
VLLVLLTLLDAAAIHPDIMQLISSSLLLTEQDLAIAGLVFSSTSLQVLKANLLAIVCMPYMGEDRVERGRVTIEGAED